MNPYTLPGLPPSPPAAINRTEYYRMGIERTFCLITTVVSRSYGKEPEELQYKCRKLEIREARQICMTIAHKYLGMSQELTAFQFGKKHCTVHHSCRVVRDLYAVDRVFRKRLSDILDELRISELEGCR